VVKEDLGFFWGEGEEGGGLTLRGLVEDDVKLGTEWREFCFNDPPDGSPVGNGKIQARWSMVWSCVVLAIDRLRKDEEETIGCVSRQGLGLGRWDDLQSRCES
jgi:hypothetical protein